MSRKTARTGLIRFHNLEVDVAVMLGRRQGFDFVHRIIVIYLFTGDITHDLVNQDT
jgi:hypothetical protein